MSEISSRSSRPRETRWTDVCARAFGRCGPAPARARCAQWWRWRRGRVFRKRVRSSCPATSDAAPFSRSRWGGCLMSTPTGSWASRPHALSHSTAGRLNSPRPALVEAVVGGAPRVVNRQQVAFVREEWRVVDRWWTEEPLDRRYYEVVLESGQNVCVYRDRERGCWFTQRG